MRNVRNWHLPLHSTYATVPTVLTPSGRDAARDAVSARIATLGFTSLREFVSTSGVPYNNLHQFVSGKRDWPRRASRARIELALGWEPGELARVAERAEAAEAEACDRRTFDGDAIIVVGQSPKVVIDFPPGSLDQLSPAEIAEVRAAAELASLQRLREILASRARDRAEGGVSGDSGQGPGDG